VGSVNGVYYIYHKIKGEFHLKSISISFYFMWCSNGREVAVWLKKLLSFYIHNSPLKSTLLSGTEKGKLIREMRSWV
jgi:hypothetical protein